MSLKNGFEYCLSKGKKGDVLISMDCDNSHTVPLSFKMINLILNKNKDIVIASRYRKKFKNKWSRSIKNFVELLRSNFV